MLIRGRCHCGNIAFSLRWEPDPVQIPARACDCTFCARHGSVWTSYPAAVLRIGLRDPAGVSRYAFGTRTADFLVCTRCGVVPAAVSRIGDRCYAVVNVNTFVDVEPALVRRQPSHLGEEAKDARLDRRKANWIGSVEYVEADALE